MKHLQVVFISLRLREITAYGCQNTRGSGINNALSRSSTWWASLKFYRISVGVCFLFSQLKKSRHMSCKTDLKQNSDDCLCVAVRQMRVTPPTNPLSFRESLSNSNPTQRKKAPNMPKLWFNAYFYKALSKGLFSIKKKARKRVWSLQNINKSDFWTWISIFAL